MSIQIITKGAFEIIREAVNKSVNLIKPTYGPSSNKVIISKVLNRMVVDDGVQIARDLELEDPVENAVLNVVREVAVRTNDRVGDGTTGALIMVQSITEEVAALPHFDGRKIEKELKKGLAEATKQLKKSARPVSGRADLLKVARISFDDAKISEIIADTWHKIGKDGVVTVDSSGTMETFAEVTSGITMNRGYISPYMVTNPSRMESVVEKPYILLTDYRLTEMSDIIPIMEKLNEKKIVNLVVICDNMEGTALGTAIINKMQGKFNLVAINLPSWGEKTNALEDIAMMVGAKVFSEKKGDKLELAEVADLGRADRFISKRTESVIVGPRGDKKVVSDSIEALNAAIEGETNEAEKKNLKARLARFKNKVAVVKVGAATESEARTLRYKVEDAINATQAAFKGGVVCGAGLSLARLVTSSSLLNSALKAPFAELRRNTGLEVELSDLKANEAVNAVTGKKGKFMDVGVADPVDVIIAGVESAVSIASLLVTTSGMIVEPPKKIKQEE